MESKMVHPQQQQQQQEQVQRDGTICNANDVNNENAMDTSDTPQLKPSVQSLTTQSPSEQPQTQATSQSLPQTQALTPRSTEHSQSSQKMSAAREETDEINANRSMDQKQCQVAIANPTNNGCDGHMNVGKGDSIGTPIGKQPAADDVSPPFFIASDEQVNGHAGNPIDLSSSDPNHANKSSSNSGDAGQNGDLCEQRNNDLDTANNGSTGKDRAETEEMKIANADSKSLDEKSQVAETNPNETSPTAGNQNIETGQTIPKEKAELMNPPKNNNIQDSNGKLDSSNEHTNENGIDKLDDNKSPTNPAPLKENITFEPDNDDDDEEDDPDISFATQEMNSNANGLLTQAGSMSEDDEIDGENNKAMDVEYEGTKVCDSEPRPPTIDTSEQVPLSGLTGPSQYLSLSAKSSAPLTNDSNAGVDQMDLDHGAEGRASHKEPTEDEHMEVDQNAKSSAPHQEAENEEVELDQDDAGQTEDTFGSLYGAETQLLPSVAVDSTKYIETNKSVAEEQKAKSADEQKQSQLPDEKIGNTETANNPGDKAGDEDSEVVESKGADEQGQHLRVGNESTNLTGEGTRNHTLEKTEAGTKLSRPSSPENKPASRNEMKITPQKGVLSMFSYPNDHLECNNLKDTSVEDENRGISADANCEESQDLLEVSPTINRKRGELPTDEAKVDSLKSKHVARNAMEANGSNWLLNHSRESSPRLVLPGMKSNTAEKSNGIDPVKPTAERESLTAEETDDESVGCNDNAHPLDNDPIEDTQTQDLHHQNKSSSLKRLSRGTPMYSSKKKDSSPKAVSSEAKSKSTSNSKPFSTRGVNSSLGRKSYGKQTTITPKVLQYAKPDEESESEAEFEDEESFSNKKQKRPPSGQSPTDYRALKQLEAVEEFTKRLPSAEELNDLASRKQLREEMEEMRRLHSEEVNALKAENYKLHRLIKRRDNEINEMKETIREKDEEIEDKTAELRDKNKIISKQESTFTTLMDRLQAISTPKTAGETNGHQDKAEEDDDSESGSLVLSALKRPAASREKKHNTTGVKSSPKTNPTLNKAKKRQSSPNVTNKDDSNSRPFSADIWKDLQAQGWKYKTGPEPYNKVYVPPDGSTHSGTSLGIHFFHDEQVVDAAIKRGHIKSGIKDCDSVKKKQSETDTNSNEENNGTSNPSENEWSDAQEDESNQQKTDEQMDDSKLIGQLKLITLETGNFALDLVTKFMRENKESHSFKSAVFNPIWQRLKIQGLEFELNWSYGKITSLSRNWAYVPPLNLEVSRQMGSKGESGVDFFITEEEVVLRVLEEARELSELSSMVSRSLSSIVPMITNLTRAVQDNMTYEDARAGKSPKTRTRKRTIPLLNSGEKGEQASSKKRTRTTPPKKTPPTTGKKKTPNTSFSEKPQSTSAKKKKTSISPAFHSSQTQGTEIVAAPSFVRKTPSKSTALPLSKYSFFCSKVNQSVESRIKKLGGQVINISKDAVENSQYKLFFLSEYDAWRRPKYMCAAALGVPMLHHEWLTDLEEKVRNGDSNAKAMSSDLYQRHRLPIGLDHSTGVYLLQRASHARDWLRPGFSRSGEGKPLFEGMEIAIAVDQETEPEWEVALTALGASVITSQSMKRNVKLAVDICLLSATSLPPHTTSTPVQVSDMLRRVPDGVPRLDLSWAHQSIIQRKKLPLSGNPQYQIDLDNSITGGKNNIYSVKCSTRRYEVGDLVEFSDKSKTSSYGRILGITWVRQGKCKLEVQLLENTGDFELTDCPSSATLFIDESCLDGNIIMLASKDMANLAYLPKNPKGSNIFRQVKQMHESQM